MTRFNETKVDSTYGTVEIGAGLTWGQVYEALESTGVNVVGARAPTVGVSGSTLGGCKCLSSSEGEISCDLRLCVHDKSVWTYDRPHDWI